MDVADAVLFVVDAVVGVTDADAAVAAVLRRSRKPVVLAAISEVDDAPGEPDVHSLWSLGLGEPVPGQRTATAAAAATCSTRSCRRCRKLLQERDPAEGGPRRQWR